jgi:hypothetical protein
MEITGNRDGVARHFEGGSWVRFSISQRKFRLWFRHA